MRFFSCYCLFLLAGLTGFSQPVITNGIISNYDFGTIHHLMLKDANNRLAYVTATDSMPINYQPYLLRTTDGGNSWVEITTFPSSFHPNKFLQIGDTIIGVGNQVWRSFDFGTTWNQITSPSISEEYEDIALLPGNNIWITGVKSNSGNYYQCDLTFSSCTLKYSVTTPFTWYKKNTQLSIFSSDTIYFLSRSMNGYEINVTYDNGTNWSSKPFNMDSLYQVLGDSTSVPVGTARVSYIKYNNAMHANIFTFSSGMAHDFVTNDGFTAINIDTFDVMGHNSHEVINWISCDANNFLVYNATEDSNYGLQEVNHNASGELALGAYHFGYTINLVQLNDIAFAATTSDLYTSFFSSLCSVAGIPEIESHAANFIYPTFSDGLYLLNESALRNGKWMVINMHGEKVKEGFSTEKVIDIRSESAGIYIIAGIDGDKLINQKVMKY